MNKPKRSIRWEFDQKYRDEFKVIHLAGTDEAGRGAMAGPLVVAAIILPVDYDHPQLRDSKKLSAKMRNELYSELIEVALSYAIEIVDVATVEQLNPKKASLWGMEKTIKQLKPIPNLTLVDGEKIKNSDLKTVQLIKGDDLSLTIAAASILAKVTRDRLMEQISEEYPQYDWARNKGYCTLDHQQRLNQFGLTPYHRKTYAPVKKYLKNQNQKLNVFDFGEIEKW